jgi:hypothetical protein
VDVYTCSSKVREWAQVSDRRIGAEILSRIFRIQSCEHEWIADVLWTALERICVVRLQIHDTGHVRLLR